MEKLDPTERLRIAKTELLRAVSKRQHNIANFSSTGSWVLATSEASELVSLFNAMQTLVGDAEAAAEGREDREREVRGALDGVAPGATFDDAPGVKFEVMEFVNEIIGAVVERKLRGGRG